MNESKIIPSDIQNELFEMRDTQSRLGWKVGDICTRIKVYNDLEGTGASEKEIHKAVASIFGKASRTIREYQATAELFGIHTREQYDVLAFGHFRIAARLENPEEALQWACDQVEDTGKPATIDAMLKMYGSKSGTPEHDDIDKLLGASDQIRDIIDKYKEDLPQNIIERIWQVTENLDDAAKEAAPYIEEVYSKRKDLKHE